MPALETMDRHQTAVLWEMIGVDANNETVVGEPSEIQVRWVDRPSQVSGAEGHPTTVDATAVVAQDIPIGSLMWLGTLEDFYGVGSAGDDAAIMEVVSAPVASDLKNRVYRRTVGLRYYRSSLPGH